MLDRSKLVRGARTWIFIRFGDIFWIFLVMFLMSALMMAGGIFTPLARLLSLSIVLYGMAGFYIAFFTFIEKEVLKPSYVMAGYFHSALALVSWIYIIFNY